MSFSSSILSYSIVVYLGTFQKAFDDNSYLFSNSLLGAVSALLDLNQVLGEAALAEAFVAPLVALAWASLDEALLTLLDLDLLLDCVELLLRLLLLVKLLRLDLPVHQIFHLASRLNDVCSLPSC